MDTSTPDQVTHKTTILIVEDDTLLIKMYKTKFEMDGFTVLTAQDGEAGLKEISEKTVDFIILDVMLPKISGLDLLEKLRQIPGKENVKVIILSNLNNPADAQKALNLGAKEYLLKSSLTPSQIVEIVNKYLKAP